MAALHLVTGTATAAADGRTLARPRGRSPGVTLRELGADEFDVLDAVFAGLS
jgi:hypothetical protein